MWTSINLQSKCNVYQLMSYLTVNIQLVKYHRSHATKAVSTTLGIYVGVSGIGVCSNIILTVFINFVNVLFLVLHHTRLNKVVINHLKSNSSIHMIAC